MCELFTRGDGAGRVVRETEVYKIDMFLRRLGHKVVFLRSRQVNDAFVTAVLARGPGVTSHDVCIDINRVHGVGDRDLVVLAKNVEDVTAIALRSVGDKNLVLGN